MVMLIICFLRYAMGHGHVRFYLAPKIGDEE
jgi:hypothetical protein